MSTPGDDKPDFSEFDLPTEGLGPLEPLPEELSAPQPGLEEPPSSGLLGDAPLPSELPPDSAAIPGEPGAEQGLADGSSGLAGILTEPAVDTALEEPKGKKRKKKKVKAAKTKQEGESDGEGFLQRLRKTNPFVVILALSVVALAVAILYLALELADYKFDLKAQEAKQRAAMAPTGYSAPASTTATA